MFYYVYILTTVDPPARFTPGSQRIGKLACVITMVVTSRTPRNTWRIKTAIAFAQRDRALAFEQYLKSGSGRAFASRRL
jgi:putative endonuclease